MSRPTTRRTARLLVGALSAIAATTWSAISHAQVPAPPPAEPAPAGAVPGAPPAPPVPAPPPPAAQPAPPPPPPVTAQAMESEVPAPASDSDLDVSQRRWAIGYSGLSQVPLGLDQNLNNAQFQATDITVPAIGLRYWASPTLGVDVAVGFSWTGGSVGSGPTTIDKDNQFGVLLQGGVPFALSTYRHVSFQLIPYVAIAHGQTSRGTTLLGAPPADLSGTRMEVGARAGFEVFFGFMGLPQLALSATVGFRFEYRKYNLSSAGFTNSDTTLGFSTTVQNSPWDIFTGNVAARYYF